MIEEAGDSPLKMDQLRGRERDLKNSKYLLPKRTRL